MPSIAQLERFVESARLGSFSAAASKLYLAPQTVSKSVHELERELGADLFKPGLHTLTITPMGELVLAHAADVVGGLQEIARIVKANSQTVTQCGSLRVAVCFSPLRGYAFKLEDFAAFARMYPLIDLKVSQHPSSDCLDMLSSGVVDAAIVMGRPSDGGFSCAKVKLSTIHLLVSKENPLCRYKQVSFEKLADIPVALPFEFGLCYRSIVDKALSCGVKLSFEGLEMCPNAHERFLHERLGGLFVCGDPGLHALHPNTKLLTFDRDERVAIPYYLVWPGEIPNPLVNVLSQYLLTNAPKPALH